jgi:hypothetical protein
MWERAVQVGIVAVVAIIGGILVVRNATTWGDWVVFGVIVITVIGFAIAIAPNLYARRRRVISRTGGGDSGIRRGSGGD